MSEPRWGDSGTRPPVGDVPGTRSAPPRPARGAAGAPAERRRLPPPRRRPRWGAWPWPRGLALVAASAGIGTVLSVLTGSEPGTVLGVCLVAGTIAAALAVRPGSVYLIIPVPALAYLVAAIIAGLIHDRATDTSRTALIISAAQWIAAGFLAMTAATALAIMIAVIRWQRTRIKRRGHGPETASSRPRRSRRADPAAEREVEDPATSVPARRRSGG
jgi:hypothetical protein